MSLRATAEQFQRRSFKKLQNWLVAEDPSKVLNEKLWQELDEQIQNYKEWKSHFDKLDDDYERSKELLYFARYKELKGMVKRCVMHLKLEQQQQQQKKLLARTESDGLHQHQHQLQAQHQSLRRLSSNGSVDSNPGSANANAAGTAQSLSRKSSIKKTESNKKRDQRREAMTTEEVDKENKELEQHLADCKERISVLKEQVRVLNAEYEVAKHYIVFQRVRLLKAMVRNAVEHPLVKDNFLAKLHNLTYASQLSSRDDTER